MPKHQPTHFGWVFHTRNVNQWNLDGFLWQSPEFMGFYWIDCLVIKLPWILARWWFQPIWKNISQIRSFPYVGVKMKKNETTTSIVSDTFVEPRKQITPMNRARCEPKWLLKHTSTPQTSLLFLLSKITHWRKVKQLKLSKTPEKHTFWSWLMTIRINMKELSTKAHQDSSILHPLNSSPTKILPTEIPKKAEVDITLLSFYLTITVFSTHSWGLPQVLPRQLPEIPLGRWCQAPGGKKGGAKDIPNDFKVSWL